MNQFKKAFTLLEILVVVGIIGILVGLITSSFSTAQKKARDARRSSDLKTIQNCIEQYYSYNSNFKYSGAGIPAGGNLTSAVSISCGATTLTTPLDPLNNTTYRYHIDLAPTPGTNEVYSISAPLESATAGGGSASVQNLQ